MSVEKPFKSFQFSHPDASDFEAIAKLFGALAMAAGVRIMDFYRKGGVVNLKSDCSPVTEADQAAEALILKALAAHTPKIPVVAEESVAAGRRPRTQGRFILVDPLDGTREFIEGRDEFTVNIALIDDRRPVCGAIYAPALGTLWIGVAIGDSPWACKYQGAPGVLTFSDQEPLAIRVRSAPHAGWTALASRSHQDQQTEGLLAQWPVGRRIAAGSSIKFCKIAEGEADVYPRCGPTMEWDTAAGDAILRAAGGCVEDLAGAPLLYDKPDWRNGPFVAWGRAESV